MVRYALKTAYRDGTTHVVFERGGLPYLDFMAKLAAVPIENSVLIETLDNFIL